MSVLTFPAMDRQAAASLEWALVSNTQVATSPLSQSVQTLEMPGARWQASLPYVGLTDSDLAALQAFMVALNGQAGRFYLWNMARPTPRGSAGGTPVVAGAAQVGKTLVTSGWTPSTTVLKAGDFFGAGGELKMITADAVSDSSGNATLAFGPALRASPASGSVVVTNRPTAVFRLSADTQKWTSQPGKIGSVQIDCIETFA